MTRPASPNPNPKPALPILFRDGWRVFFLAAGLYAVAAIGLWTAWLAGGQGALPFAPGPIGWHAHEMIFGFATAALGGFFLTAVPNWTGARAAPDRFIALVAGLWLGAQAQPVRTLAPDAPQVEILAARAAWVRVSAAYGTVLLEKTMDAGERFALPTTEKPPTLRSGNSGAIYFAVNGKTYGPAAPGAQVVKNVELSSAALSGRFALADPASDPELAKMVALASAGPMAGRAGQNAGAGPGLIAGD